MRYEVAAEPGVGNGIEFVRALFEYDAVEQLHQVALEIVCIEVGAGAAVFRVEGLGFQIPAMVFGDDDDRRRPAQWTAPLFAPQTEKQLLRRTAMAVPACDQAGKAVGEQAETAVVLANGLAGVGFVIGVDGRVTPAFTDQPRPAVHHPVVEIVQQDYGFQRQVIIPAAFIRSGKRRSRPDPRAWCGWRWREPRHPRSRN